MITTYLHFTINSVATANLTGRTGTVISPTGSSLSIGTIARHVSGVATHAADNASSVVLTLRTIVFPMANLATVLTCLIFVVSEGSVESRQLTKLISLQFILALGNGRSL